MKKVILMRHAKSSWETGLNDKERPLNSRGKKDAPCMGNKIAEKAIIPDLVISSTSARTKETLSLMPTQIQQNVQFIDDLYLASSDEIFETLRATDNIYNTVLILAHNPGISCAFYDLARVNIDNVPTSGVGCITFNVSSFSEIKKQSGFLDYFMYPKMFSSS